MKKLYCCLLAINIVSILHLILSWMVKGYSDFFVEHIFGIFGQSYGRLTGLFSFSIGEIMLYAAVVYGALSILLWLIRFILWIFKKNFLKKLTRVNTAILALLVTLIIFVQVNNCFVWYHTSRLFEGSYKDEYNPTDEDLIALQHSLANAANSICLQLKDRRSENGALIIEDDLKTISVETMENLGKLAQSKLSEGSTDPFYVKLSRLTDFVSKPKPLATSKFFSQQNILGYYFPFSLEANYNTMMYIANYPSTMCHELSHLKGFIREDEANFISYLACINSDDLFVKYSGILNLFEYVNSECYDRPNCRNQRAGVYKEVVNDMVFLTEDAWVQVEESAVIDTQTVAKASNEFLDTNLTLNGVEEGVKSYTGVVALALKFYFSSQESTE